MSPGGGMARFKLLIRLANVLAQCPTGERRKVTLSLARFQSIFNVTGIL